MNERLAERSFDRNDGALAYMPRPDQTSWSAAITGRIAICKQCALAVLIALGLSGCGGGDGGASPATATHICVTTGAGEALAGALPGSGTGATYSEGNTRPTKGDVVIDIAGNYTYTPRTFPSGSARGMDQFSYRMTDPNGGTTEAVVTVLIDGAVRIMPLGDSITAGVSAELPPEHQVGYRRKLFNDLASLSTGFDVDFVGSRNQEGSMADPPLVDRDHEGHPGACDDIPCTNNGEPKPALDEAVDAWLSDNPADLILLHIGTNQFSTDASGVDAILDNISTWAQLNHPVTVFLARIIPSRGDPEEGGPLDVERFNNNVETIANARPNTRIIMVDQQSEFAVPGDPNRADPTLMADHLHPNEDGYKVMATRWRDDIVESGVLPACQ